MSPDLSALGVTRWDHPLPGGHRNTVWRVMTADGPAVAKSTTHDAAAIHWLEPLHAAARAAGFVVPGLHVTRDNCHIINGWTVEDFVEGERFTAADMPRIAARITAFHSHAPMMQQRPGAPSLPTLTMAPLADLPPAIAAGCRAALTRFALTQTQPIHGDITAANLIHTPPGPALIDWDEARCDLPFLDLVNVIPQPAAETRAHLAWEIITAWKFEPAYAKACARRLAQT